MKKVFDFVRDKFVNPNYPFQDRLYFLFGAAGVISAGAAFVSALISKLPPAAAIASLVSFFIILLMMTLSLFMKDIAIARIVCSAFLNFIMFPVLFWVTGGVDCGMVLYFIMALCVATLVLDGKPRIIVLTLALICDCITIYLGFAHPEWAHSMSDRQRQMDTVSSFLIVSLFVVAVIMIMSLEYRKEHQAVLSYNEDLKQQVITDNMTTLYNQSFLLSTLSEQISHCTQEGKTISIAMFDIDNFKAVNDNYGHLRGNQVLCQFAAILKEASGTQNIATRYGGDEFLVVLPDSDYEAAFAFAEKVRLATLYDPALQALTDNGVSVSGGVSQCRKGMSLDEFIHLTDTRLYDAKRDGKNKIKGRKKQPTASV
ncbi:MAG: GGDEF domain-containing protein [Pseudoflavonifractor sp.]